MARERPANRLPGGCRLSGCQRAKAYKSTWTNVSYRAAGVQRKKWATRVRRPCFFLSIVCRLVGNATNLALQVLSATPEWYNGAKCRANWAVLVHLSRFGFTTEDAEQLAMQALSAMGGLNGIKRDRCDFHVAHLPTLPRLDLPRLRPFATIEEHYRNWRRRESP